MKEGPDIALLASLIGDPARANMLTMLMAGKALTASELASEAGITQQTASSHLRKLEGGGLVIPRKQGRHKYFSLAGENVAHALEALMGLASRIGHQRLRTGPKDEAMREARVCYNHLAGRMGIRLFDRMRNSGHLTFAEEGLDLTPTGETFVARLGIDAAELRQQRSVLCRECLDWSERRSHLAGSLGRAILAQIEEKGWAQRDPGSRAVLFNDRGMRAFADWISD